MKHSFLPNVHNMIAREEQRDEIPMNEVNRELHDLFIFVFMQHVK
jgi:hypothetical protein